MSGANLLRMVVVTSHPIQYQAPLFRALAQECDLTVYFAHRQTPESQAAAGFGVPFDWDIDLLSGYRHAFLRNVARKPDAGRFFGCDTPEIGERIAASRPDAVLVLGWHLKTFWQAVRAARRLRIPVMVRGDSHLGQRRPGWKTLAKALIYPRMLSAFDGLLHVGVRNRDYLLHYGVSPGRLFLSPHCVDTQAMFGLAREADRAALRREWELLPGESAVLFVGKLMPGKRPMDLVEALASVRAAGRAARIVWAGEGPQRAALAEACERLGVPMTFLGFCNQSRLPGIYAAADLLVLPSAAETWGLVVNEAMACGTPCVVSDACGCAPDMVDGLGTGIVYPCGDVQSLARAICDVLADPACHRAGLRAVTRRHSVAAAADGILQATRTLTARP